MHEKEVPLIQAVGLKKYFEIRKGVFGRIRGHVRAVDGVSFSVWPGETVSVVGESGCGKTTLGRLILRLLEATDGEVFFRGRNLREMNRGELRNLRRRIQIVFQDPYGSLNPRMTIGSIIGEGIRIHRLAAGDAVHARVKKLLDMVGLPVSVARRYPHEFSGGQRQRISIARALAVEPEFIVADEPVSALDVSVQAQIINLLQDIQRELGLTYLFISHDLSVVRHISDRVMVMYLGRIVEIASRNDLYEAALHPYTRALLSAVPSTDLNNKRSRREIHGDVPDPAMVPLGCPFHPRCSERVDACLHVVPELIDLPKGRQVACLLHDSKEADVVVSSGEHAVNS